MKVVKIYDAVCDECGNNYSSYFGSPQTKNKKDAITEMQEKGWKVIKGQTVCQICNMKNLAKNNDNLNFLQAVKLLDMRIPVESLVSHTTYEMTKTGLLAEGKLISFDHFTTEEVRGGWREVRIIKTKEDFNKLSINEQEKVTANAF